MTNGAKGNLLALGVTETHFSRAFEKRGISPSPDLQVFFDSCTVEVKSRRS